MIVPNKHTIIKTSILYIAGIALKEITVKGTIKYDELKKTVTKEVGQNISDSFEYALSFLFLQNKILYNQSSDTFSRI